MTVPERDRHLLYERLDEVLGHAPATTLMDLLPPIGWGDVARRSDLDAMRDELRHELTGLELRMERSIRNAIYANFAATASFAAALIAAIRI